MHYGNFITVTLFRSYIMLKLLKIVNLYCTDTLSITTQHKRNMEMKLLYDDDKILIAKNYNEGLK